MDRPPPPPVDLLSSFPEHLQDEILTRLDLRDAVRTSALSRAWRHRWETIPGLVLSFPAGTPATSIYGVLLRYAGPSVSGFLTTVYGGDEATSHVNDWLIALSRRSIESINIFNNRRILFTIHSSIFSCDRLVSLSLEGCCIPPLPQPQPQPDGGFAGFPMLKELYLTSVCFADSEECQLRAMIRASPMLRVLLVEEVSGIECVIEAPNLHTLGLISYYNWQFGELPCLQCASINVTEYLCDGSMIGFLAGVSHVEELIFNIQFCQYYHQNWMDATPFTFSNLKSMELSTDFYDTDNILLMFCLLRRSPNLEKLKVELQQPKRVVDWKFLNAQWTDGMCANLQVVEITSAKGWLPLSFMKLILSKASHLCTLSVDACPFSQDDPLNELLNYRRASPQAQVKFKVQLERIRFDRMKFAEKRLN